VSIAEEFSAGVTAWAQALPGLELLPERLARAAAPALSADGAGLSLFFAPDRRLPLGASDEDSAAAERFQFTVGEGPCLAAHAEGQPVLADEADIERRWPAFHDALRTHTPFRAAISLPLQDELRGIGALDLYFVSPLGSDNLRLTDALTVTERIVSAFVAANAAAPRTDAGPAWLDAPAAQRRSVVWQAIGYVNAGLRLSSTDALAVLRGYAYAHDRELDDVAQQVVGHELPVELLDPGATAS
jgi:hypothetical protein